MTKAIVPLAAGAEEMETVIIIDILRRAEWDVTVAGVDSKEGPVQCSRSVQIVPDCLWEDIETASFDGLVIPGGADGTARLCASDQVTRTVREFANAGKLLAAICAGPLVLQAAGIITGLKVTSHPAVHEKLESVHVSGDRVVVDGNVVTSQGPGTAFEFALTLIKIRDGGQRAKEIADSMVFDFQA